MKRSRSNSEARFSSFKSDGGALLQRQHSIDRCLGQLTSKAFSTEVDRPSKLRRQGSKLLNVLRSLTNSVSQHSLADSCPLFPPIKPQSPTVLGGEFPASNCRGQIEPTVVHRTEFKSRPSVMSFDKSVLEIPPEGSPPSSAENSSGNSTKTWNLRPENSTGKTSVESKVSSRSKDASNSSENKKTTVGHMRVDRDAIDNQLAPIPEVESLELSCNVPTIITVEKAAAAKIFFETYYNKLISGEPTPRSIRRRQFERLIFHDNLRPAPEKSMLHRSWAIKETNHLRETRVMKCRGTRALNGKPTGMSKYDVVKVLGKGSFGVVRLVREKVQDCTDFSSEMKQIYAMKVIRKSDMLRNSQEGHLRAERDFLVSAEGSRWVVPLIASFQDLNSLYLVMDYMPGGDFLGLLIRENVLSEPVTRWYIAEMILCIEEAHALHWIHRDVKPDNFLISASGHLKISDFGLAFDGHWSHDQAYFNNHRYSLLTKLGISVDGDSIDRQEGRSITSALNLANVLTDGKDRHELSLGGFDDESILNWRNRTGNRTLARSVVGTSQYMAPEVIRGEYYDGRCDWWSVAIILYECLFGHTPFLAAEGGRQQTKLNILKHKETFSFPRKPIVSKRCQDLIRLLIQEKEHRLCSKRYKTKDLASTSNQNRNYEGRFVYPSDAEDIKSHKWFRDIQWEYMHMMVPPFIPDIKSLDDTHYFDEEETISDFSDSVSGTPPTIDEIADALRPFNREIQILATEFIDHPHDSTKFRKVEREIDEFNVTDNQKEYLKAFVKRYGRKEKKRPRDKILRDREVAPRVLELRKRGAFLGYTYRRFRPGNLHSVAFVKHNHGGTLPNGSANSKKKVWHRARLSIL